MQEALGSNDRRLCRAVLAVALTGLLAACAAQPAPASAPAPAAGTPSAPAATAAAAGPGANQTASAKPAKPKKPAKIPKNVVPDEAAAIVAGKEACLQISETYDKEHWRAQNQRGVWRVWVTPVHCEGGGTCPTYETHITAADGVAGGCKLRVTLN